MILHIYSLLKSGKNFWVRLKRIYEMGLILVLCHQRVDIRIHRDKVYSIV